MKNGLLAGALRAQFSSNQACSFPPGQAGLVTKIRGPTARAFTRQFEAKLRYPPYKIIVNNAMRRQTHYLTPTGTTASEDWRTNKR